MRTLLIAFIGVLLLGGLVYFAWPHSMGVQEAGLNSEVTSDDAMKKDDAMTEKKDVMMEKGESMEKKDDAMMDKSSMSDPTQTVATASAAPVVGSYEAYAEEKLSKANAGDVVLFFRASWCPTCRAVDADIKKNLTAIPAGLVILDVNYDTATDLKKKYGVTYQHTFVQVDAQGNQIAKWSGSQTLAALASQVK